MIQKKQKVEQKYGPSKDLPGEKLKKLMFVVSNPLTGDEQMTERLCEKCSKPVQGNLLKEMCRKCYTKATTPATITVPKKLEPLFKEYTEARLRAHLLEMMLYGRRFEEAIQLAKKAMPLSHYYPGTYCLDGLGITRLCITPAKSEADGKYRLSFSVAKVNRVASQSNLF